MVLRYNRLKQGYQEITPQYKQLWLNLNSNTEFEDALTYIYNENSSELVERLCKFMYKFKFSTYKQIEEYIELCGYNKRLIDIPQLISNGILSQFVLSPNNLVECTKEEVFFSIGPNGGLFLKKFLKKNVSRWLIKDISLSPIKVIARLDIVDFYLNLIKSYGFDRVNNVSINPMRSIYKDAIGIDLEFELQGEDSSQIFITQQVSRYNINTSFPKTMVKIEKLLKSSKIGEVFDESKGIPRIILICENEEILNYALKKMEVSELNKISKLMFISVDYIIRVPLKEYNLVQSINIDGQVVQEEFFTLK
ncbi:hypothetical protein [Romboutsia sp.]|uniref:hypothetical protein n=1 Tax=Romboutsia sp. TaxID=1965302 RepID=UPI003F2C6A53